LLLESLGFLFKESTGFLELGLFVFELCFSSGGLIFSDLGSSFSRGDFLFGGFHKFFSL